MTTKYLLILALVMGTSVDSLNTQIAPGKINQEKKTVWDKAKGWVIGGSVILGAVVLAVTGYLGAKKAQDYIHLAKLKGWLTEPDNIPLDELASGGLLTYEDVKWLLDNGATVKQRPSQRYGPNLLFEAISLLKSDKPRHAGKQEELRKIARLVVERNVNINERTGNRNATALMNAARSNDVEMVKIVLSGHPDATLSDIEGHDALWYANQNLAEYTSGKTSLNESVFPSLKTGRDNAAEIIRLIQSYQNTPETRIENL